MVSTITDRLAAAVDGVPVQISGAGVVTLTQTSGTNDVVATAFPPVTEWVENQLFAWRPTAANTGAMTLTITGVTGAKTLKKPNGSAMTNAAIAIGRDILMRYDGTDLKIMDAGL